MELLSLAHQSSQKSNLARIWRKFQSTLSYGQSDLAIARSDCFHSEGDESPCHISNNPYMIMFGVVQVLLSQIPDFDQLWWLSIVAAVMSFTYSSIGLCLGLAKVVELGHLRGSLTGVSIGSVTEAQKIWRTFQALGNIAFAYSYSMILIEIQDTIKSPPAENKTMKKATMLGVATTTVFYMLCGCLGYAAFGDDAPGNLLTGFGFYNPFCIIDIANAAIVIHLVGAYQEIGLQRSSELSLAEAKEDWKNSTASYLIGRRWRSCKHVSPRGGVLMKNRGFMELLQPEGLLLDFRLAFEVFFL